MQIWARLLISLFQSAYSHVALHSCHSIQFPHPKHGSIPHSWPLLLHSCMARSTRLGIHLHAVRFHLQYSFSGQSIRVREQRARAHY
ncbi:hypothetical protein EDD15DRAFT_1856007 [Pisolithus albus]|nr:hypothetical protein EDD15DRAFT_1856007 [Pisolithus albus]